MDSLTLRTIYLYSQSKRCRSSSLKEWPLGINRWQSWTVTSSIFSHPLSQRSFGFPSLKFTVIPLTVNSVHYFALFVSGPVSSVVVTCHIQDYQCFLFRQRLSFFSPGSSGALLRSLPCFDKCPSGIITFTGPLRWLTVHRFTCCFVRA